LGNNEEAIRLVNDPEGFRLYVVETLGAVRANVQNVLVQMKTHKEDITELFQRMNKIEQHPGSCEIKEKISTIKLKIGDNDGVAPIIDRVVTLERATEEHFNEFKEGKTDKARWKSGFWIPMLKWFTIGIINLALMFAGLLVLLHIEPVKAVLFK
jgi:hypothetical protein